MPAPPPLEILVKARFTLFLCAFLATGANPVLADLKPGDRAPDFTTRASLNGKEFTYRLADALRQGPVVVYFYPQAFTKGCTVEAHLFAEAIDRFKALGATVIGVSNDAIDVLNRFSASECAGRFPVASDADRRIMKGYDAVLFAGWADRVSYVVAPDGTVIYAYSAMNPDRHVENTLSALREWRAKQP